MAQLNAPRGFRSSKKQFDMNRKMAARSKMQGWLSRKHRRLGNFCRGATKSTPLGFCKTKQSRPSSLEADTCWVSVVVLKLDGSVTLKKQAAPFIYRGDFYRCWRGPLGNISSCLKAHLLLEWTPGSLHHDADGKPIRPHAAHI